MKHSKWFPLRNPFLNPTRNSIILLLIILADHVSKLFEALGTHEEIDDLYNRIEPNYQKILAARAEVTTSVNTYRGMTARVDKKLDELKGRGGLMAHWEARLLAFFKGDSIEYTKEIFPHRRKPFTSGKRDMRIQALKGLIATLKLIIKPDVEEDKKMSEEEIEAMKTRNAGVEAIRLDILKYYNELFTLRKKQQGVEKMVDTAWADVRALRVILVKQLDYDLRVLTSKVHGDDMDRALEYYTPELVRRLESGPKKEELDAEPIPLKDRVLPISEEVEDEENMDNGEDMDS